MISVIHAALGRSRMILLILALILIAGSVAYVNIAKESDPDINIPIIYVVIPHEGISPEDAERLLIRPMEQGLRAIEGVKEMRSTGALGLATVLLEFEAGFNSEKALNDVRRQVDFAKGSLPAETDEPEVHEVNLSLFPVLVVILSGEVPERTLVRLARDLRDRIESVSGVLEAAIVGDRGEVVEVVIDPVKVESYGLSPAQAAATVGSSNLLVAAGTQDTGKGRFSIKVPALFESVLDIAALPVRVNDDTTVRLGDVAEVRRTFRDANSFARVDGRPAIAIEVSKRTGINIIDIIDKVRSTVEAEHQSWPEVVRQQVTLSYSQDRSGDIRTMLTDLQNNVLSAVLLVMVVVVATLGVRAAGLVGVAIPGSFLTAIFLLYSAGLTINTVVLFSLILAVGMLVDGAIVVTELADRKMIEGLPRRDAYEVAAKRMTWPIIASTATTLAAFSPLLFWPGVVGEFMKFLPITVLVTLSASLIMALIFVPTVGGLIGKPSNPDLGDLKVVSSAESGDLHALHGITGRYLKLLETVLGHPGKVLLAAVVALLCSGALYGAFGKGIEFFPEIEPQNAVVQVRARGNMSVFEQDIILRQVEQRILGIDGIETIYTSTGGGTRSDQSADIIGSVSLEFLPWNQRRPARQIMAEIERRVSDIAGVIIDARKQEEGPPAGKPIHVRLSARKPELLPPAAAQVREAFQQVAGLTAIEDSQQLPGIDWEVRIDQAQAAKFGVSVGSVGNMIRMATGGYKLGSYRPTDSVDEVDILARFPEEYRTLTQLGQIRVATSAGAVPISNFILQQAVPKVGSVNRVNGYRFIDIKADVAEGLNVDATLHEVQALLAKATLDHRVQLTFKGENEEQAKAKAFLLKAFIAALFLMAIILVTQFNRFYSAFLVLFAVVLSTIGVLLGLLITGQPFGIIMNGISVIALAGIVVNNNIVLIDTFHRLEEVEHDTRQAILRTCAQRLRPVLLTTVTTILGLLPMTFGVNIDFIDRTVTVGAPSTQWWSQLATAIVFGLGFATLLTLLVTPSALMFKDNMGQWWRRRWSADEVQPPAVV